MENFIKYILFLTVILFMPQATQAEDFPSFTISLDYKDSEGEEDKDVTSHEGSAPITATFNITSENTDGWDVYYEWRVCHESGNLDEPYLIRREENPEIIFSSAGRDSIGLYIMCTRELEGMKDTMTYWRNYWTKEQYLTIKASSSELTFPNAFSPNGDGINDFFKPKKCKSITEFHATIYNRWGQKLYEWDEVNDNGWDGTFNGHNVKQGVYFIKCSAKGADGEKYEIRKDVNLLRGYTEARSQQSDM